MSMARNYNYIWNSTQSEFFVTACVVGFSITPIKDSEKVDLWVYIRGDEDYHWFGTFEDRQKAVDFILSLNEEVEQPVKSPRVNKKEGA
jgi:hypothetical protein